LGWGSQILILHSEHFQACTCWSLSVRKQTFYLCIYTCLATKFGVYNTYLFSWLKLIHDWRCNCGGKWGNKWQCFQQTASLWLKLRWQPTLAWRLDYNEISHFTDTIEGAKSNVVTWRPLQVLLLSVSLWSMHLTQFTGIKTQLH